MEDQSDSGKAAFQLAYKQAATSYEAITQFRGTLLGLLPLATGTGAVLLLERKDDKDSWILTPIGLLGVVVTLGLFAYELRGMQRCHRLERQACALEERLGLSAELGPFRGQPKRALFDMLGPPAAGLIIYLATAFAWLFVAGVGLWPEHALDVGWRLLVFYLVALVGSWLWVRWWLLKSASGSVPTGWSNLDAILSYYVDARRCRNLKPIEVHFGAGVEWVGLQRNIRYDVLPVLKYVIEGGHTVRDLELAECDGHVIMTARRPGQEIGGKKLDEQISFMFAMGHKRSIKKVGAYAHQKDAFAAARCEERP